jgi:hypothetical protein
VRIESPTGRGAMVKQYLIKKTGRQYIVPCGDVFIEKINNGAVFWTFLADLVQDVGPRVLPVRQANF